MKMLVYEDGDDATIKDSISAVDAASYLTVKVGDVLFFDVLEWFHEGWEFRHPALMLRPIVRYEDHGVETLVEKICIDLCTGEKVQRLSALDARKIEWRGWNLPYLRRCFTEAFNGREWLKAHYKASRTAVEFVLDGNGDLTFITTCNGLRRPQGSGSSSPKAKMDHWCPVACD